MAKTRRDPLLRGLGANVKRLRESKGWTQETAAAKATLDRSYVAGIEAGLRNPSTKALAKLAAALGVTLSDLFKGVG
jgi:transcriptional regulator with XRE-family HTH domain